MNVRRIFAACAVALGLVAAAPSAAAPLEAYGQLPSIETAAVSPSGHAVAYAVTNGEQRAVIVKDLASGKFTFRTVLGDVKVRALRWAGDRHLVLVSSMTAVPVDVIARNAEYFAGFVVDLGTGRLRSVMEGAPPGQAMNVIADYPVVRTWEGRPTIFVEGVYFVGGNGRLSLFRVPVERAGARLVQAGVNNTRGYVVGADGAPVAQELYDGDSGRWTLRVRAGDDWKEAASRVAPLDPPYVLGLGRDAASVIYAEAGEEGRTVWREVRLDGRAPGEPIIHDHEPSPIRDPQDARLIGHVSLVGDEPRYTFFAPEDGRAWNAVGAAFPGAHVSLASWSSDRRKIVVRVDSPTEGPAFSLVDLGERKATWLGAEYTDIKPADISPVRAIRYKAADGLELSGYLTLPRGRAEKGLPLVVFPHGGPASRDTPGFDWWAQAMASRGYAVLQVNFRGSEGLGTKLLEAGYGQWGRKMQTDLSDGVRHLASQGIVDPKRVCIVGASYGGYAALAGAALDPGVYRCAASVAGVTDLRRFVDWSKGRSGRSAFRYWTRFMGAEDARDPKLAEISPAAQAGKVAIPVLLVHGRDDTVVPLEQSRIMADALRDAGKPVELVVQPGADHWLSRGETRLQTLTSVVAFLEKHNPPQ